MTPPLPDDSPDAAAELKRRLDAALLAGEVGTFEWRIEQDEVRGDRNFNRIFGVDLGEGVAAPIGRYVSEIVEEDRAGVQEQILQAIEAGGTFNMEYRLRDAGRPRWVVVRGIGERDEQGRVTRLTGAILDITHRKLAEEAELVSRQMLEIVVNNIPAAVTVLGGRDLRLRMANPAFRAIVPTAVEGRAIEDLWGEAARPFAELCRQVMETGQTHHVEDERYDIEGASGRPEAKYFSWSLHRVRLPGDEGWGLLSAAWETTLRKRAEQALEQAILQADEANRQKDHFLAMLGHELRNPLAPIRNAVAYLRRVAPAEPRLRGAHELIERQVVLMTRLIDDLLDVSRIARGKITLKRSDFDLAALLRTAVEDHRPLFEANSITLSLSVPDEPLRARGDSARIAQIVSNLLVNANKFTNPGGRADVELSGRDNEATIRIRDTGIGIDPGTLRLLFEPFAQADRSIDRSRGGLGLGLALVKGLVELHGGHIGARSEGLGRGTEFTVVLPILQSEVSASAGPAQATEGGPPPHRILIVEDNVDAAETLKSLLELGGHEVSVEHTGAKGVEAAKREHPDVVLCDIGLPGGMDGYAVGEAMRRDPELVKVKLIALTGYGQEEDKQRARRAGFDRHLTKPIDPDALERLLAD